MKYLLMAATPLLGIVLFLVGLAFSVFFVGLPYQDPTPAMQARYDFRTTIASMILLAGGMLFLIGLLLVPVLALVTRKKKTE